MPRRKSKGPIDWAKVESEYRSGQLTVNAIAKLCGCSPSGIAQRARKQHWSRDLSDQVRQEIRGRLIAEDLYGSVQRPDPRTIIQDAATKGVEVVREHRKDIQAARKTAEMLVSQLQAAIGDRVDLQAEIDAVAKAGDGRMHNRRITLEKAVALPTHCAAIRDLAQAMSKFVGLERQAFSLDDANEKGTIVVKLGDREASL